MTNLNAAIRSAMIRINAPHFTAPPTLQELADLLDRIHGFQPGTVADNFTSWPNGAMCDLRMRDYMDSAREITRELGAYYHDPVEVQRKLTDRAKYETLVALYECAGRIQRGQAPAPDAEALNGVLNAYHEAFADYLAAILRETRSAQI